jgi:hypothetical protein
MKLFRFTMGHVDLLGAFEDATDAYERRNEVDHTFDWTPVVIEEVVLEGYEITVTSTHGDAPKNKGGRPRKEV